MAFHPDWNKRPKIVPPASKADKIIEVIALIGVLLSIIIVIYSATILPEIIPTHYNISGGVDTYGSKWPLLVVFLIPIIFIYALITVVNKYPYNFNYLTIVTEENALRIYSNACTMMRCLKAVMIWMALIIEWFFVMLLPNNPGLTGLSWISWIIMLLFFIVLAIIIIYAATRQIREGKQKNTI
jgi:uncharacterized membrane protein